MSRLLALYSVVATTNALLTTAAEFDSNPGTGCQKKMTKLCDGWETDRTFCLKCVKEKIDKLKPECTLEKAENKCKSPPAPPGPPIIPDPPAPPAPPVQPRPGAPQPHLVLFVVDDQGYANVGFHNKGNVKTPNMDALAKDGVILERHYTFRWCAPTRSALMTGRLPYHVLQNTDHVSRGFTMLPRKLQTVGYSTHQVGKWHLGFRNQWMTPVGRGFNSSLGYLSGGEDHYTQMQSSVFGCTGVDLYQSDHPAIGHNGTYGAYIYNDEIQRVLDEYHISGSTHPLFFYVALQTMHAPQQVPSQYSTYYTEKGYTLDYGIMNGMATIADEVLGNLTATMKRYGLWNNTLLIHTSDNGGPAGIEASGHCGNNYPLRGGKTNFFEGGIRVTAYASGGFLPSAVRGQTREGYIHSCDWYPTFSWLAGVDAADNYTQNFPPVDGVNMWPYLKGEAAESPRTEMMIGCEQSSFGGALINGSMKYLVGNQSYGDWWAPVYPNASTNHKADVTVDCMAGCLFNIQEDPSEYRELSKEQPNIFKAMQALYNERCKTTFEASKYGKNESACEAYRDSHEGFLGPYAEDPARA